MSLAGCQVNPIDFNFYSKKVWKFLMQIPLTKSNSKITRGVKVPCLMPIRVKQCGMALTKISLDTKTGFYDMFRLWAAGMLRIAAELFSGH